jgi:hypothetical protein
VEKVVMTVVEITVENNVRVGDGMQTAMRCGPEKLFRELPICTGIENCPR